MSDKNKILADELAENNDAIDSFQIYSRNCLDRWVLTQDGFFKAVANFLNSQPEETDWEHVANVWHERYKACLVPTKKDHTHMCMKCGSRMITRDTGDYVVPAPETDEEIAERVFIECFDLPGKGKGAKFKMFMKHYEVYIEFCDKLTQRKEKTI